jgi:hypothetical protein
MLFSWRWIVSGAVSPHQSADRQPGQAIPARLCSRVQLTRCSWLHPGSGTWRYCARPPGCAMLFSAAGRSGCRAGPRGPGPFRAVPSPVNLHGGSGD